MTGCLDDLPGAIAHVGEAAAITDFDSTHPDRPIGQVWLRAYTPFDLPWADQICVHHRLDHPDCASLEIGATGDPLPVQQCQLSLYAPRLVPELFVLMMRIVPAVKFLGQAGEDLLFAVLVQVRELVERRGYLVGVK
ncbi:hypothetical protein [Streptomyces sp. NPDC007355]|uniref:hypothetical protein n=1 Tax=Streptomyces sp. NPDC007355 TaxID=3364778 RepID=UPI0036A3C4B4